MGVAHGPRGAQAAFADRLDDQPRGQRCQRARARLPLAAPLPLPRRLRHRRRASSVGSSLNFEVPLVKYSYYCIHNM